MKLIREKVNEYEITIDGRWCEIVEDGKVCYNGNIEEGMSAIDAFNAFTAKKQFILNNKILASYTIFGSFKEEENSTKELLASKYKCNIDDIKVINTLNRITSHEIL